MWSTEREARRSHTSMPVAVPNFNPSMPSGEACISASLKEGLFRLFVLQQYAKHVPLLLSLHASPCFPLCIISLSHTHIHTHTHSHTHRHTHTLTHSHTHTNTHTHTHRHTHTPTHTHTHSHT